ncbi:MAG: hypothetical protein HY689_11750 [Chloroflexi bacterium]|nr:hypothetical protein [Chloroflexota bacterium]
MFRLSRVLIALTLTLVAVQVMGPGSAAAHERRQVGKYTFVVGFSSEPAIEGEPNGVDLRITHTDTNAPVEGAEQTLKVAVAFGGNPPKEFPLRARFGQPGAYTADLIPTRSGVYSFTFTGTLDGQPVNERFESGPGRFNDVQSAQGLQFPEPVPATSEMQRQVRSLERQLAAAEEQAGTAQAWAFGGVAVGALGLAVGLYGLLGGRRREESAVGRPARTR